jgi:hypothetical protein
VGVTCDLLRKTGCYLPPFSRIGAEAIAEASAVLRSNVDELILRDYSSEMISNVEEECSNSC